MTRMMTKKQRKNKHFKKLETERMKREKVRKEFEKRDKKIHDEQQLRRESQRQRRESERLEAMNRADDAEDKGLISVFERGKIINESVSLGSKKEE